MDTAKYVRIYCDDAGESHFEDMDTELVFMDFAPPAAPLAVAPFLTGGTMQWLGAPSEWEDDTPHPVPRRTVMAITQGEVEIMVSDGDVRTFPAGAVFLIEDTWGKGHQTKITSDIDVIALIVALADQETSEQ